MTECLNPLTDSSWDAALASRPDATVFHSAAWARVLSDTYGFTPCYLRAGASHAKGSAGLRPALPERVAGSLPAPAPALPLLEIDSWLTGRRGASLPFTDECEPLCDSHDEFTELFTAAVAHGKQRRWRSLELRGGHRWLQGEQPSVTFHGHQLTLTHDIAALFNRLDSANRRALRKAEQSKLTIEFSTSLAAMREFYGLLRKTRQRHGVPPQPFRFFAAIQRDVLSAGSGTIILARHAGAAIAGAVYLQSGNTVIYKFGASDAAAQPLRANNLVMWRAIEWYAKNGYSTLDFGRTSLGNDGLRRFKLSWGTTERPIHYFKYDLETARYVTSRDQASGWHTRVFQMLPRSVSQWIGTLLYKHIA